MNRSGPDRSPSLISNLTVERSDNDYHRLLLKASCPIEPDDEVIRYFLSINGCPRPLYVAICKSALKDTIFAQLTFRYICEMVTTERVLTQLSAREKEQLARLQEAEISTVTSITSQSGDSAQLHLDENEFLKSFLVVCLFILMDLFVKL